MVDYLIAFKSLNSHILLLYAKFLRTLAEVFEIFCTLTVESVQNMHDVLLDFVKRICRTSLSLFLLLLLLLLLLLVLLSLLSLLSLLIYTERVKIP
jgi:lipopolysaccharide/colanic/teichoic acid biosynthesis glycosyltransferase